MFDETILEQRSTALEQAVANLQRRLVGDPVSGNWVEKITGSISDESAFLEALELGRAWRHADRNFADFGKVAGLVIEDWTV